MDNRFRPPTADLDSPLGAAANNSGGGKGTIPPEGVKGWSWGAFLMNWIWGVSNKTWIALLAWIPFIGIFVSIYLGIKGRELAWRNKRWDSLEHFQKVQRRWSVWSGVFVLVCVLLGIASGYFGSGSSD
jgi:hypothetical protein